MGYNPAMLSIYIADNPCKIDIKPDLPKQLKEGDRVSLRCITSSACSSPPYWVSSGSMKAEDEKEKSSQLSFTASWTDNGRTLTCRPPGSNDDICLDRSITLDVECGYRGYAYCSHIVYLLYYYYCNNL